MTNQITVKRVMEFWPLIKDVALGYGLDPKLLAGLVCQESAGVPDARRFEPKFRWFNFDLLRPNHYALDEERAGQQTSWGLCQVMGVVAREKGFNGEWPELFDPKINLMLGANHLRWCIRRRNGNVDLGLLRYNGGGDTQYPTRVFLWAQAIEKFMAGSGVNGGVTPPLPQTGIATSHTEEEDHA